MTDLSRQFQAFKHEPDRGIMGDCYRTAVACVLGVERDTVPHSHDDLTGEQNAEFIDAWLHPKGYRRLFIPVAGDDFTLVANTLWKRGDKMPMIVTGCGPRSVNHVIVVHGIDDFWCPTLGACNTNPGMKPALPDNYFWAEWIVRPAEEVTNG